MGDIEQRAKLEENKKDYLETFSSGRGKKVLEDLEKVCFINKSTYSEKPGGTFINEGMRMVVVHIKNTMNFNLDKLEQIMKEKTDE